MDFVGVLTVASTGLAFTASVVSVVVTARSARQTSRAQATVRVVDLKSAIEDRPALRRVLYTELGSVRVSDYVSYQSLRMRFDELIAEVAEFVASPEEPKSTPTQTEAVPLRPEGRVPPELERAFEELLAGDSWAALARLRRILEVRLSTLIGGDRVADREVRGAGQQLRRLRSIGALDEGWYRQLGYVVSVCNSAVHGEDVPPSQAAEVLDIVARWMESASE